MKALQLTGGIGAGSTDGFQELGVENDLPQLYCHLMFYIIATNKAVMSSVNGCKYYVYGEETTMLICANAQNWCNWSKQGVKNYSLYENIIHCKQCTLTLFL